MEKYVIDILQKNNNYLSFIDIFDGLYVEELKLTHITYNENQIRFFSNNIEVYPNDDKKMAIFATIIDFC